MTTEQLIFDENMEMYIELNELANEVCLYISDGLLACEEEWTEEYKIKIINFINAFLSWQSIANDAVLSYGKQTYGIEITEQDLRLINIFILFEQNANPLFGVGYRTEYDVEHGCGLKIKGDNFEIVEIGSADVAFC